MSPSLHQSNSLYFYYFSTAYIGDLTAIRDAGPALEILDIDGDGVIGLLDFIHFAARLKAIHQVHEHCNTATM